jgi:tetratricopeptide (TPR) repeat protein
MLAKEVVSVDTPDKDLQSERMAHLGAIYQQRYELSGARQDLEESIRHGTEAIILASQRERILSVAQNLGLSLSHRYYLCRNSKDLTNAIHYTEISLKRSSLSPRTKSDCFNNLAILLTNKWRVTGADDHLTQAIAFQNRAIDVLKPRHPRRAFLLARMAAILSDAYEVNFRLHYIDGAIQAFFDALEIKQQTSYSKQCLFNNFAMQLLTRFRRTGNPSDLELAIQYFTEALEIAPTNSEDRSVIMANLSNAFQARFGSLSLESDLMKSLDFVEAAHRESPASISIASWLSATNIHLQYFHLSGDSKYLDSALEKLKSALDALPQENTYKGEHLVFFAGGHIFLEFSKLSNSQECSDLAVAYYLACWEAVTATPIFRIKAARNAARLFSAAGNPDEAWNILQKAVDLVPMASFGELRRREQQFIVSQLSGLGNEACSAALAAGVHPLDALEILERGRGITIASAHGAASQLAALKAKAPELYREYDILRTKINTSDETIAELRLEDKEAKSSACFTQKEERLRPFYGDVSEQEHQISELKRITNRIQNEVPGFSDFMVPLSTSRISSLAQDGPIITLVAGYARADAILLTNSGTEVLPLTSLLPDPPQVYLRKMAVLIDKLVFNQSDPRSRNSSLRGALVHLWKTICGPVCQALKLEPNAQDSRGLPIRIWWIATGLFARLPLHAAGIYLLGDPSNTVPVRAVSSYIASFRMLEFARSQSQNMRRQDLRGMLIMMSKGLNKTENGQTIDSKAERKKNGDLFVRTATEEGKNVLQEGTSIQWHSMERPSSQKVLLELSSYNVLHACCHGISDPEDPGSSHLKLYSRQIDTVANDPANMDPLTVSKITQARPRNATLAYLAACSTADVRAHRLLDEGIQIGNAFQLAGFPHVIATLWPAADHICPTVAQWFYRFLSRWTANEPLTSFMVAFALHCAVGKAMVESQATPLFWASFIHQGA